MLRALLGAVVIVATSGPGWAQIKIRDVKARHGAHGPLRSSLEIVPGDEIVFSYAVGGMKTDDDGRVNGELKLKVTTESGEVLIDKSSPVKDVLAFGGATLPGFANLNLGLNTPPGKYKFNLTFIDSIQNQSDSFERILTCRKPEFAIVKPRFSFDDRGESSASLTTTLGQRIYFNLAVVGFDKSKDKIDVTMKMQFTDEKGNSLMPKPLVVNVATDDTEKVKELLAVPFRGSFNCNRIGNFKLKITVIDNVAEKTTTFEAPVKVGE